MGVFMGEERSLVENVKHYFGKCGGFCFGGQMPDGVTKVAPLKEGVVFPNGAKAAIMLTFDVEGNYGNGTGDEKLEIANYKKICAALSKNKIPATFNIVGKMVEDNGPEFVSWMLDAGSEIAPHGYVHDMNKRYGGDRVYAGHYDRKENFEQIGDGVRALEKFFPGSVKGIRLPYGHFNEYSYEAAESLGLKWTSHVGIDDFMVPGQGFGPRPFRMRMNDKTYPMVEIPLDSQTYDWATWMADEKSNGEFVRAVAAYCKSRGIEFKRTPSGAVGIWRRRLDDAVENESLFTFLCHPVNLAVRSDKWGDAAEEFILPVIEMLGSYAKNNRIWACTCAQMAEFYSNNMKA